MPQRRRSTSVATAVLTGALLAEPAAVASPAQAAEPPPEVRELLGEMRCGLRANRRPYLGDSHVSRCCAGAGGALAAKAPEESPLPHPPPST